MPRFDFRYTLAFAAASLCLAPVAQAQVGSCNTAAINVAYTTMILRAPNGSGNGGECNAALYGPYSNQVDLNKKVVAWANAHGVNNMNAGRAAAPAVPSNYPFYVDPARNLVANTPSHTVLAQAGTWDLRNPDGSAVTLVAAGGGNLVAAGGGNLVAAGGGNLVAAGGGNMVGQRSLQSAGGKKVFVVKH